MANQERQAKVNRFENYNFDRRISGREAPKFHDNDVRSIKVLPCSKKGETSAVEITFFDREEKVERILKLKDCVNLRFSIDFDILSDNTSSPKSSAGQTSNVEIKECNDCLRRLMKQDAADWNVEYPPDKDTPASYKLWQLHEFILVKALLHGGTLEVVARDFEINTKSVY
jgi:hypothetical protein